MRRDGHEGVVSSQGRDDAVKFGPDDDGVKIPTQVETLVKGTATVAEPEYKAIPDLDYLQVPFSDHRYLFLIILYRTDFSIKS
jgi:hypothetical protein